MLPRCLPSELVMAIAASHGDVEVPLDVDFHPVEHSGRVAFRKLEQKSFRRPVDGAVGHQVVAQIRRFLLWVRYRVLSSGDMARPLGAFRSTSITISPRSGVTI